LDRELKENLCGLVHSLEPITATLPEGLSYACTFWIQHTATVTDGAVKLGDRVHEFFQQRAIHWLEAMSVLKQTRQAITLLQNLMGWIDSRALDAGLRDLIWDSWRFCQYFADIIEEHPLAIYHVVLPFAPRNSLMYQKFHREDTMPRVFGDYLTSWPSLLLSLTGHNDEVKSIAISPDGSRIMSSSVDKTIRVWDITTGALVLGPLDGYEEITHVAFSLDGERIVSCSPFEARVWDAVTGVLVVKPQKLRDRIILARFSPTGSHIILITAWGFISHDTDTICNCEWNLETGAVESGPLRECPPGTCYCTIAASPTEPKLALGRGPDIFLQDAASGSIILGPLQGHMDEVVCVAFSPDGSKIVSRALDGTICAWDSVTGVPILGPLMGLQEVPFISNMTFHLNFPFFVFTVTLQNLSLTRI